VINNSAAPPLPTDHVVGLIDVEQRLPHIDVFIFKTAKRNVQLAALAWPEDGFTAKVKQVAHFRWPL